MICTQDIMASLPLVASVLGDRYGVKVHIGGKQAYTNGKSIHLPTLPLHCNATLLAQARGFLDHEAAHIRHTDFDALQAAHLTPLQKHLWNTIEDWRVENRLAALFPGCRQHFHWLIQHHFGGEDAATPAFSVLNYVVLSVRTWDVPEIADRKDAEGQTMDAAYPGLRVKLDAILLRVRQQCQSTQDAIAYALELHTVIAAYSHQAAPPEQKKSAPHKEKQALDAKADSVDTTLDVTDDTTDDHPTSKGNKDTADSLPDTPASNMDNKQPTSATPDDTPETPGTDHSVCASPSEEDVTTDSQAQTQQSIHAERLKDLLTAPAEVLPKHLGEHLAGALTEQEAHGTMNGLEVAQVGIKHSGALPEGVRTHVLQSTTALRTRLHGLLQAKAQQPCIPGRRGKLNPQKLHTVTFNNPKAFLRRGSKTQVATAVHLLLDCSGSMQGERICLAMQACYAVAVALERCPGVNVAVTLFPASTGMGDCEHTVAPLVKHGERVHDRFNVHSDGYTPLAQALWWVMQRMYPLKETRKIICILSDGQPDSPPMARSALFEAHRLGFEIVGLGIQDASMALLLPSASRTIHTLSDLAPAMFEMLQGALLTQAYA